MSATYRLEGIAVVDPRLAPPDSGAKWCRLFPGNTTRFRDDFPREGIAFDRAFFERVIANWERLGRPRLPVDYAHDEAGIAAGWIQGMQIDGDGNLEALIAWNDRARAAISAKELAFLSPTFALEHRNPLDGTMMGPTLFGAALLNTPFLHDLPAVQASRQPESQPSMSDFLKKVCGLLGLPDDTNEDTALSAFAEKMKPKDEAPAAPSEEEKATEAARVAEVIELARKPLAENIVELERLRTEIASERDGFKARVAELDAVVLKNSVEDLVRVSLSRGIANAHAVVKEAMELGGSIEKASKIVAMVQPSVQLGEVGHSQVAEPPKGQAGYEALKNIAMKIMADEKRPFADALELAIRRNPNIKTEEQ